MEYLTLTDRKIKGFKNQGYIRVSTSKQTGKKQRHEIESHFPFVKTCVVDKASGHQLPVLHSLENHRDACLCSVFPDRVIKSYEYKDYKDLMEFLVDRRLKFRFPNLNALISESISFWNSFKLKTLNSLLLSRIKRQFDSTIKDFTLTEEQHREVKFCHRKLVALKSTVTDKELRFWLLYGHIGQAINKIIHLRSQIGIENRDTNLGNDFRQIRLFHALLDYEPRYVDNSSPEGCPYLDFTTDDFIGLAQKLSDNRQIRNQNNERHDPYRLKQKIKSETYVVYREFVLYDIPDILKWIKKKVELDYPTVIPKKNSVRKAMLTLGFKSLYKEQNTVLKQISHGKNIVHSIRTGGGKNAIPILYSLSHPHELVLVVSPLLALMSDYRETLLKTFNEKEVYVLNSDTKSVSDTLAGIKKEARIFITTPEQLRKKKVIEALKKRGVGLFVVDECHHLLASGAKEFRVAWKARAFKKAMKQLGYPPSLLMSATIDSEVISEIDKVFDKQKRKYGLITGDLNRPNLELFTCYFRNRGQKLIALCKLLKELRKAGLKKGIVYFSKINNLEKVEAILNEFGFNTLRYHGKTSDNLSAKQKQENMELYRELKSVIMLSTSAFGEGIDFKDVGFVVQFDIPESKIELAQWAGRAGRNGKKAPVIVMIDSHGVTLRRNLIKLNQSKAGRQVEEKMFEALLKFFENNEHPSLSELNEEFVGG